MGAPAHFDPVQRRDARCALTAALSAEIRSFAIFEILLYSFAAATVSGAMVMLAEEMSVDRRALGQSLGGLAASLGGGVCVGIMPILAAHNLSWRWLLALSAGGIFVLPAMACSIPESRRWEEANTRRPPLRIGYWEVFQAKYHRRSIPSLVSALLTSIAATAAMSWPYYHAVAVVGLSAGAATAIVLICGGAAMAGFTAGAWAAEEFGRVQTILVFGIMAAIGGFAFYWARRRASPFKRSGLEPPIYGRHSAATRCKSRATQRRLSCSQRRSGARWRDGTR